MKRPWSDTFRVAFAGIAYAIRTQRNMRVHAAMSVLALLLGSVLQISTSDWLWLGLAITIVISAELMNTAVESVVDLVMPKPHPLAKVAKDTAAGAVLVTAVFAVIVGVAIFFEPGMKLIGTILRVMHG